MNAIAAVDENWGIGCEGRLLCPIRADLRRFKALTTGHSVILGRKTLETFPGGRPLPDRANIVLSRDPELVIPGARVVHSVDEALALAGDDSFVIGGESVYRAFLPYCRRVYLTRILAAFPADAWFPDLTGLPGWRVTAQEEPLEENGVRFRYVTYERGA